MSLSGQTTSFSPFGSVRVTIWSAPGTTGAAACTAAAARVTPSTSTGSAPRAGHRRRPASDHGIVAHCGHSCSQRWLAIQRSIFASSTSSGSAPSIEHRGVELADVELRPEFLFGARAQLADLELADLVGERLARDRHVAFGLGDATRLGGGAVRVHVIEHLLAGPALRVQARVDDEADRAPQFAFEAAEVLVRVGVHAEFLAQRFRIQAPAFAVRGVPAEAAELRQALLLALDRDLEMVAGIGLVQRQRFHRPLRPRAQVVGVRVEDAGTREPSSVAAWYWPPAALFSRNGSTARTS